MKTPRSLKSVRHSLINSTAMVGALVIGASAAQAQLPDSTGAVFAHGGGVNGQNAQLDYSVANNLSVNLRDNRSVIDWTSGFNIDTGNTVTFNDGRAAVVGFSGGTANIAVLNRDLSGTRSTITGTLNAASNVEVYLVNTSGILFSAGSAVNVGSLVASALNLTPADFLGDATPTEFHFLGTANTIAPVEVQGGSISATSAALGQLVLIGAQVNVTGGTQTARTDAAFVAATDITVQTQPASPLSISINRGTTVQSAVTANGTLAGRNVTLAFATQSGITNALLGVNGTLDASTAIATDRGIVLAAGTSASGVALTPLNANATSGSGSISFGGAALLPDPNVITPPTTIISARDNVTFPNALLLPGNLAVTSTNAGTVTFGNTVNSRAGRNLALTVNTGGLTRFAGAVGGTSALASLTTDATGTTQINANVSTTGGQTYNDAVTLTANATLASAAAGNIAFNATVDSDADATPRALTVNTGGITIFNGLMGDTARLASLTTDFQGGAAERTQINGDLGGNSRTVRTSGGQRFDDDVTLGGDTQLVSTGGGDISFGRTISSDTAATPRQFGTDTGGVARFRGAVGGGGFTVQSFTTSGSGTAEIGANITTSQNQLYQTAVRLIGNATLASVSAGNITFESTLRSDATARTLAVNTGGQTRFGSAVGGGGFALASLETDAPGALQVNADIATTGAQTYNEALVLTGDAVLTSTAAGDITFAQTVDSDADATPRALTVNTGGLTIFSGLVGDTARLASLTTDFQGGASERTRVNGGPGLNNRTVRASGAITLNDDVTLGGNTQLVSTGGGNVVFGRTVGSDAAATLRTLRVDTGGVTRFRGEAGPTGFELLQLVTDAPGSTEIGANITTSLNQDYGDAVGLIGDATLTSATNAAINFDSTVDGDGAGPRALTVNTGGLTSFAAAVGGTNALGSLTTDAPGTTQINGDVTTTGAQSYNDLLGFTTDTTLTSTSAGNISFAQALNSPIALTVNTSGVTRFAGADALASLVTDAGGTTELGGDVTTSLGQQYGDAVTLAANATLASSGNGNITFGATLDSDATARTLAVNTGGRTRFAGNVGGAHALASLTSDAPGTLEINANVTTTGAQTYNEALVLTGDAVLTSTAAGDISFARTIDSDADATPRALTVNTAGRTIFTGLVGDTARLAALTTDNQSGAGEGTRINGGLGLNNRTVRASGAIALNDAALLGADTLLVSTGGGDVSFGGPVDSDADATPRALTVNTGGQTVFGGLVGDTARLALLTTDFQGGAGEATRINGGLGLNSRTVRASGAIALNDAALLGADTLLVSTGGGDVSFGGPVDSDADATPRALTVDTGGRTIFNGLVGDTARLASLTTDFQGGAGETTQLNGGVGAGSRTVRAAGDIAINDDLLLGADTALVSTGGGTIRLARTVSGNAGLIADFAATTTGAVDLQGTADVRDLALNGGTVSTVAVNAHDDVAIRATGSVTLGDVTSGFASAVDTSGLADALVSPASLAGGDIDIQGASVSVGRLAALGGGSDIRIAGPASATGQDIDLSAGGDIAVGDLTAARDVALTAGGAAQVAGAVNAGRDYSVTGQRVALGDDADAELQSAAGRVIVRATGGAIVGGAGLTLVSNSGGASDAGRLRTLNLDATGGDIAFDATSAVEGGTGRESVVGINLRTGGSALTLGTVRASDLRAVDAGYASYTAPVETSGEIALADVSTTGALDVRTTAGSIRAGTVQSLAGGVKLDASDAVTGLAGQGQPGFPDAAFGRAAVDAGAGQDVAVTSGGLQQLGVVAAGRDVTLNGDTIDALTVTGGRDVAIGSGGLVSTGAVTAGDDITVRAAGAVTTGALVAGSPIATDGAGAADTLAALALSGNDIDVRGTSLNIASANTAAAGSDVRLTATAGNLTAGQSNAGGMTTLVASGTADAANSVAGGALSVTAANIIFRQGGGATTSLTATGNVTVAGSGRVYASGAAGAGADPNPLQIEAGQISIGGVVEAAGVTLRVAPSVPAGAAVDLGDGLTSASGNVALGSSALNNIQATTLTLDAGARAVNIGALPFDAQAGSGTINVLTSGNVTVTGTISLSGTARTLQLGGSAPSAGFAARLAIIALPTGGGRIDAGDGTVSLRATRIGVGQRHFLDRLFAEPGVAQVTTDFSANPNSELYAAAVGGAPYFGTPADPSILIRAGALNVVFGDYALFQNTGINGGSAGVQIGALTALPLANSLGLTATGSAADNSFALFGTIGNTRDRATALLGFGVIPVSNVNLNNARINGCLIGSSGGGCLITQVTTPLISIFDPGQVGLLTGARDLEIAFDPLVGTGNEAFFSDLGSIDLFSGEPISCADGNCSNAGGEPK